MLDQPARDFATVLAAFRGYRGDPGADYGQPLEFLIGDQWVTVDDLAVELASLAAVR